MEKDFTDLVKMLFEATKEEDAARKQSKIADSGGDLDDVGLMNQEFEDEVTRVNAPVPRPEQAPESNALPQEAPVEVDQYGNPIDPNQQIPAEEIPAEEAPIDPNDPNAAYANMPMDDAAYLEQLPEEPEPPITFSDSEKILKIFDLLGKIKSKSEEINEKLENIDLSVLDRREISEIELIEKKLEKLKEKIESFVTLKLKTQTYEAALYVYLLFRSEFIVIIKDLRKLTKRIDDDQKEG